MDFTQIIFNFKKKIVISKKYLQVEASPHGVVWGVSYDSSAWVYTGGWGGAHHKPAHSSRVEDMADLKYLYNLHLPMYFYI